MPEDQITGPEMTHITPRTRQELAQLEPIFEAVEASTGFVPTSMPTMATTLESSPKSFALLMKTLLRGVRVSMKCEKNPMGIAGFK